MVDCDTLPMDADEVLFANDEWRVLADGLEHRQTGYFIERAAIARRRDGMLWDWPFHLAEKRWCSPRALHEAFLAALDRYGIAADAGLAPSFALAFGLRPATAGAAMQDGFVALGDVLKPQRSASRKRMPLGEVRAASRRDGADRPRLTAGVNG